MTKKFLLLSFITFFKLCFALNIQIKENKELDNNIQYFLYESQNFPLNAHVIAMPINKIDCKLVPAIGQREEVASIAKRCNAYIAINGSNYRRGGKYNGNRLNLFYLYTQIYSDLQFVRGAFGWNSKNKIIMIDKIFLKVNFFISEQSFPVDQINQPRIPGMAVIYTHTVDISLLQHTPGKNMIIDNNGIIHDISFELPNKISDDWLIYQVDKDRFNHIQKNMKANFNYEIKSLENNNVYNDYDFVIGGAGLLLRNGKIISGELYDEFSQGTQVIHSNDEVASDFHTKKMQEWLIEQRHPRTAIGITDKNEICIVVVDGRQDTSEGLNLHELAEFMQELGCVNALNIGGGGCSTLYIDTLVVNKPSAKEERPVSEALCFFKA